MDIFSIITLMGGLAFFLYGMNVMSCGLEKMTGGKLERALKRLTSNKYKSLLLGAGITIAIQSSSAMTVMLVGFVNSGIMELSQTIGIIMGSNIGTTLTAWILSLAGIQSDNFLIRMLNPEAFSPIIALVGICMIMISKKTKNKDIGTIMVGFSVLMFGMDLMSQAVSPLSQMPEFSKILVAFQNPLLGVLVGTVFTGIIQSSAASVGILQALSLTGGISYGMAIPIIMGQNIGTCVTAILSSFGVSKNAKKVAAVHIYFNIIGTAICLTLLYVSNIFFDFAFMNRTISPVGIALIHTIFNITTTMILFPFTAVLEKLANCTIKDSKQEKKLMFLDERLLATPSVAISECMENTVKMGELVKCTLNKALNLLNNFQKSDINTIEENELSIDKYEDNLGTFLVKLNSKELSDNDSREISKILHVIGDFERIGDHSLSIARVADELNAKEIKFSEEAMKEITILAQAVQEIVDITETSFHENNVQLAQKVEPLEQVIDIIKEKLRDRHIDRLKKGVCTIEQGFIFNDLLTNCERISDHCSNIAVCIIQINDTSFETHEYLNNIKKFETQEYKEIFITYKKKFQIK